jgi:YebC/PmpR family DNA-binding regulatory protein
MSGHSKWSTIKRKKGAADAKRGKIFSKFIKEISVAARAGGGDIEGNPRLRTIVDKAKAANMPNDNIDRAIKRGTGDMEGVTYEESSYEGYGPHGVAILIETLSDNKKRTVAEVRHALTKAGGSLGESGCVAWMFKKKGMLVFDKEKLDQDKLMDVAIEAGAEDIKDADDTFEVTTQPDDFESVKNACQSAGLTAAEADIQMIPQSTVKLDGEEATKMLKLMELLEDLDDVQNVYANFDIDASVMEKEMG